MRYTTELLRFAKPEVGDDSDLTREDFVIKGEKVGRFYRREVFSTLKEADAKTLVLSFFSLDASSTESFVAFCLRYGAWPSFTEINDMDAVDGLDTSIFYVRSALQQVPIPVNHFELLRRAVQSETERVQAFLAELFLDEDPKEILDVLNVEMTKNTSVSIRPQPEQFTVEPPEGYRLIVQGKNIIGAVCLATYALLGEHFNLISIPLTCSDCGKPLSPYTRGERCEICRKKSYKNDELKQMKKRLYERARRKVVIAENGTKVPLLQTPAFNEKWSKIRNMEELKAFAMQIGIWEASKRGRKKTED